MEQRMKKRTRRAQTHTKAQKHRSDREKEDKQVKARTRKMSPLTGEERRGTGKRASTRTKNAERRTHAHTSTIRKEGKIKWTGVH